MIVTLCLIVLLYVLGTAGVAQLQLLCGAMEECARKSQPGLLFDACITLFFALPFIIASGLISATTLRRYHVRTSPAYIANAIVSAILGAYAFIFNFGVADNLGAILEHVPKNGRDITNGMVERSPPFFQTVSSVFRDFPAFVGSEFVYFGMAVLLALALSIVCGCLFWILVVRRSSASPD